MADNFLQFSAEISKLSVLEALWVENHFGLFGDECPKEGDESYEEFTELIGVYELEDDDDALGFDWNFDNDGGLEIYAELNGNPDHVAAFAQMFLRKFRPNDAFSMSWATTCSPMRLSQVGGGAIFVTAEKIEWVNAWTWCQKKWQEFRFRKSKES